MAVLTQKLRVAPDASYLTIGQIEVAWNEALDENAPADVGVHLDLSGVSYVDQECLPFLLAVISDRHARGLEFSITLPPKDTPDLVSKPKYGNVTKPRGLNGSSNLGSPFIAFGMVKEWRENTDPDKLASLDRPVEFLLAWGLDRAVKTATGKDLEEFLTSDSRRRLEQVDRQDLYYMRVIDTPFEGKQSMLPETYFSLTPIAIKDGASKAASIVTKRFLEAHIVSVLDLYLKDLGSRVASYILHEGVLNAARHPSAKLAYSSAQVMYKWFEKEKLRPGSFDRQLKVHADFATVLGTDRERALLNSPDWVGIPRQLVMSIWDNGKSFAETLAAALKTPDGIRSGAYGREADEFKVLYFDRDKGVGRDIYVVSDQVIDPLDEAEMIVWAFMQGITENPLHPNLDKEKIEEIAELDPSIISKDVSAFSGLGLHLIRRNVIDLFGGSIQYISGGYRLTLVSDGARGKYKGFLTKRELLGPSAEGNLLVVRLPLQGA